MKKEKIQVKNDFEEGIVKMLLEGKAALLSRGERNIIDAILTSDKNNLEKLKKAYPKIVNFVEKYRGGYLDEELKFLSKKDIIKINQDLGKQFNTAYGPGANKSNLDFIEFWEGNAYYTALEILRGHPFIDGNKRTAFMVYMLLTSKKSHAEILNDFYDIFQSLSR